jgi:hypothetical protein
MGGLGGSTGGRWRRRRIGSIMVVLVSFQHVIGMARQNSAKPDFSILSAPTSSQRVQPHPTPFTHFLFYWMASSKVNRRILACFALRKRAPSSASAAEAAMNFNTVQRTSTAPFNLMVVIM